MLSIRRIHFFFLTDNQLESGPSGFLPPFSLSSIFFPSILKKVNDQPARWIRVPGAAVNDADNYGRQGVQISLKKPPSVLRGKGI